jgi:Flp pilus assembly protein CpaB
MNTETMLTIFAIVAALGLVAVLAVDIIVIAQEAEASRGCKNPKAVKASAGRCIH